MRYKPEVVEFDWSKELPVGADGWSILPSPTNTWYVSSSIGNDNNNGTKETPFKTIRKGLSKLTNGSNDHVLLKRGDTWVNEQISINVNGKSDQERIVIGSWGDSGFRPVVLSPKGSSALYIRCGNLVVRDIDAPCWWRDPSDVTNFDPTNEGATGASIGYSNGYNILIEGCRIRFWRYNATVEGYETMRCRNISFRRNVLTDSYAKASGHAQGIYAAKIDNLLFYQNIFDMNGWHPQHGPKTMFNHAIYTQADCHNVVTVENIILRPSLFAWHRAGGAFINNFVFRSSGGVMSRSKTNEQSWNVMLEGDVLENVQIGGGGYQGVNLFGKLLIKKNLAIHKRYVNYGGSSYSVKQPKGSDTYETKDWLTGRNFNLLEDPFSVVMEGNVSYNWAGNWSFGLFLEGPGDYLIQNNIFYENHPDLSESRLVGLNNIGTLRMINNQYWSTNLNNNVFGIINGKWDSTFNWNKFVALTGETGKFEEPTFKDPSLDFNRLTSLLGYNGENDFYEDLRLQSRFRWKEEITADKINTIFRNSYNIQEPAEPANIVDLYLYDMVAKTRVGIFNPLVEIDVDSKVGIEVVTENAVSLNYEHNGVSKQIAQFPFVIPDTGLIEGDNVIKITAVNSEGTSGESLTIMAKGKKREPMSSPRLNDMLNLWDINGGRYITWLPSPVNIDLANHTTKLGIQVTGTDLGSVEFVENNGQMRRDSSTPFIAFSNGLTVGQHTFVATPIGPDGVRGQSRTYNVTVINSSVVVEPEPDPDPEPQPEPEPDPEPQPASSYTVVVIDPDPTKNRVFTTTENSVIVKRTSGEFVLEKEPLNVIR